MKKEVIIRQETTADIPAVQAMLFHAFGGEKEAKLVDALRKNPDVFVPELSLVAVMEDQVVGHIFFSKVKIVDQTVHEVVSLALAPMAVAPGFQKNGIGRQLMGHGLAAARDMGFQSVIVLGHENYYPRFGFVPTSRWHIHPPFQVPSNVYLGLELVEGGLQHVSGTVQYPAEFEV
ncbi:GNAT family N-acetyltransferase [Paraflavitalea pollutisoli]|uniref:GNAT family N-acetyltransferase n=1 Tax=Paraflavitalea pollutisoli TaxID=3034143 RepID=UPI0023EB8068|nr:N-acetyltransferase [Paraflavitalea sp. H1-2-19X]